MNSPLPDTPPEKGAGACEILIVGGGPVGLLLANLLGAQKVRTLVVEKRREIPAQSMAIGITPPSLEILGQIGLDTPFCRQGIQVTCAVVHEQGMPLGQLAFSDLPSPYRFVLSLPQSRTLQLLRSSLARFPSVQYLAGLAFVSLHETTRGITARVADTVSGQSRPIAARYLVGCDGHESRVRHCLGLRAREKRYPQKYVMADFDASPELGTEAHLFFGPEASVESFPLPGGRRRWITLDPRAKPADPASYLIRQVRAQTGYDLAHARPEGVSPFSNKRQLVSTYYRGRALLCGDAAHVMSSIGGQGMNTGFADAEFLADILPGVLRHPHQAGRWFARYDQIRRQAFQVAANRAARGMWLGTRRGQLASRLRRWFIRDVLFTPWVARRMAPYFAMLTVPFNHYARAWQERDFMDGRPGTDPCPSN